MAWPGRDTLKKHIIHGTTYGCHREKNKTETTLTHDWTSNSQGNISKRRGKNRPDSIFGSTYQGRLSARAFHMAVHFVYL